MDLQERLPGFISDELTETIRELAAEAEKGGSLHPRQLDIIYKNGWFNLFVPKQYGGLELSLPEGLRIEESLARADGSTGWTVTLCSGANWFIGFLQPESSKLIFKNPKVCFAGSGYPGGIAKCTPEGYEINGYWKYATGAPHATIFTANCIIEKDGVTLQDEEGNPLVRAFWFTKEEVILHKNWNCIGMIATASHPFEIKNLAVSQNRCFSIDHTNPLPGHAIYRFPFQQFAEATLAVNSLGMAMRFLELCGDLFTKKKETNKHTQSYYSFINEKWEGASKSLGLSRQLFYTAIEKAWNDLLQNRSIESGSLSEVSKTSRSMALISRQVTDDLYPYCGIIAANPSTEINRVWRNMHTASQHGLLNSGQ